MRSSKGFRKGTRSKLKKRTGEGFRIGEFLKEFKADQMVAVKLNPSSHKGMPHPRFEGKIGRVKEKRGNAYLVEISVGKTKKSVLAKPEHLKYVK